MNEDKTLSVQQAPLVARLRQAVAVVRPVSQVLLTIKAGDANGAFKHAQELILRWMQKRAGRPLPIEAWEGRGFEIAEIGTQRAEAIYLEDARYWAARLDDADKNVAQRTWATEIAIARSNVAILFGARLTCVTRGQDVPFLASVPGFVYQIVDEVGGEIDNHQIETSPWIVDTDEQVDAFVDLICDLSRQHSIYVFSLPDGSEDTTETILPVDNILRRTIGTAHLAIITSSASYKLTDRVGKEFSVFRQAMRTYRPGLNLDESQPFDHPLALAERIERWTGGPEAFGNLLIEQALRSTVSRIDLEAAFPPYTRVRQVALDLHRKVRSDEGATDRELLELALEENESLKRDLEEQKQTYDGLLGSAEQERDIAVTSVDEARSQISGLRARIDYLEGRFRISERVEASAEIPNSFDQLEDWSRKHLAGKVILHNRAIRAAKKSIFEHIPLAYKALLVLRDRYVPMRRRGGAKLKTAYEEELLRLGLVDEACFPGPRSGEQRDTYFVEFNAQRRELDRHLKGSDSRDPRYGFRLYFFWDDDSEQVVVGSLPSHLKTRIS